MARLTFYGHSDDLIEIDGISGADEFEANTGKIAGVFAVQAPGGAGLRVLALYDRSGVWSFAVAQLDDGVNLPAWPIQVLGPAEHKENDYSTMLVIECPDGVKLSRLDEVR